jgi:hypothetical protein
MSLETLDRTLWSSSDALAHVERIVLARRAQSWWTEVLGLSAAACDGEVDLPQGVVGAAKRCAREDFLIALRDGYLRATGRCSTTPSLFASPLGERWRLHATDPTLITTSEWRDGEFNFARHALIGSEWEYIEIEIPVFMVKAIWPDPAEEASSSESDAEDNLYTTPYLDLMQAAIAHFGVSQRNQEKKESLVAWFREQQIAGEPVSRNLAEAMATLIRLPAAQRGGAKRVLGPDLRNTG